MTAAPPRRSSPALLATAVALPVTVVLILLFARLGGGDDDAPEVAPGTPTAVALPAIPVAPPPALAEPAQKACQELISALPTTLGNRPARPVQSSSPYVAAWGDPAVVLRCGVARPATFKPDSEVFDISGVRWFPVTAGSSTVWTVVNKPVYVEVTAPTTEASDPAARLATAVSRALR